MIKYLMLAVFLTSCVTSKYITRYDCEEKYKKFITTSANRCIDSAGPTKIEECRSNAIKIMCTPKPYFKRKIWPLPGETVEKPCAEAATLQEWWLCQKGERKTK